MAASPHRFKVLAAPVSRLGRWLRRAWFLALTGATAGMAVVLAVYLYWAPTVPVFTSLADYQPQLGTTIYSGDGQIIGEFSAQRRVLVDYEKVPALLTRAFVAAEDKRFFDHSGVDILGMVKAVIDKLRHPGQKLRGASTITQQVAKSLLVSHESYEAATARKLGRKVREAILALRLEQALTKEEIIYLYVNQIFLGHKAYGVQAAAEHYFRKNVWELSLAEMATIAGLPQRPSDYSPFSRPEAAHARRRYVLRRMLEDGHITREQHDAAVTAELKVYPREEPYLDIAPYYAEQVRREIIERYGERALLEDGLAVYTALNLEYQHLARQAIDYGLAALDKRQGYRGPIANLETEAKRTLFRSRYRAHLGLKEGDKPGFELGTTYYAVVTGFDAKGEQATLDVAGTDGILPLAGMRWAREPDPTEKVDFHYLKDVRRALKKGDLIAVAPTSREILAKDTHGWEAFSTVPKEGTLFALEQDPIAQAALLSVDPASGYVFAQVGGYDFDESTYNRAVQACREPGSAFKPIVYTAAIDKLDYTPSTLIDDKPLVFDDPDNVVRWKPGNAEQEFRGRLPVRTCLRDSINIPAIRIAEAVGIEDLIRNARRLGITTGLKRELGTAIGSSCTTLFDLIQVYITINQYGVHRKPIFITRVIDRYGNVLEDHTAPWDASTDLLSRLDSGYRRLVAPKNRVLDEQTAYIMISLLKTAVAEGTGIGASRTGHVVAGKTGTTNDSFDAWFFGMTRKLVTGVWVGHDKKERPLGVSEQGGRTALPIWTGYMRPALMDYSKKVPERKAQGDFNPPVGVVRIRIDPETGLLARPSSLRAVWEYFRTGTEPTDEAPDEKHFDPTQMNTFEIDAPL